MTASLQVAHALAPTAVGGLESVVRMLAIGQVASGWRVDALLVAGQEGSPLGLAEPLRSGGVSVHEVRLPGRAYLREYRAIQAWLREYRPSILHTHGYRVDVLAGRAARAVGIPTVSTLHGFTGGDWKNRMYERLQLHTLRSADAVIAVSRPIRDRLLRIGFDNSRIHLVPNAWGGSVAPLSRTEARLVLGIPVGARVLGWVGRLSEEKGADVLLRALALLRDPEVTCSIVGDGRCRGALEAQASALGVTGRVRWHGLVPDAGRLATAFDAFVLSSRTEGTPIALFEAMAARVPIVATGVGGVPDVVSPMEALLVPAEDPTALAEAIATVFSDPGAADTRVAAAESRLSVQFALEPWLSRHDELYASLLAGRRARNA